MKNSPRKRKPPARSLRERLEEAEETLRAIRAGEIDGIVVEGKSGRQVYTLKGADESYRTLVEAMNEGALILDASGTILYANRRFSEIVGDALPAVIGRRIVEFAAPGWEKAVLKAVGGRSARTSRQEAVFRFGDREVPVQLSAADLGEGWVHGTALVVTDLSEARGRERVRAAEREESDRQIRDHVATVEKTNRELEAFVYSVSHDLRAPLRSIHRFSTVVEEEVGPALNAAARHALRRISASAEHMDELIRGLLAYSRVSRGTFEMREVDVHAVLSESIRSLDAEIRERRAEVRVEGRLPVVRGEALLLSQILLNLLGNALKFVRAGAAPAIVAGASKNGGRVRVWVQDEGIGIPPEHQERIFGVFERLDPGYPGTGIGLAIVKTAAERMGGSAGVESAPGKGSRFWVELELPEKERSG